MSTSDQVSASSYISCIDTLNDSLTRAASLAHVTRLAHEHPNDESEDECRLATAETMRIIIEQITRAQGANKRIQELRDQDRA